MILDQYLVECNQQYTVNGTVVDHT